MTVQDPTPLETPPTPESVQEQLSQLMVLLAQELLPLGLSVSDVERLLLKRNVAMAAEAQGGTDDAATTCGAQDTGPAQQLSLQKQPQDPAALRDLARKLGAAIEFLET